MEGNRPIGSTRSCRRRTDKQPWLWTDEVRIKVLEKKRLYHAFPDNNSADSWSDYCEARRAAKKSVAVAKAAHHADVREKLDTKEGERLIHRLASKRFMTSTASNVTF
ncbi:hypothetical protein Y032_0141g2211 [Ancylostoma ceylanicum]|uniref:Uncharacterized protein n=1 Tax=Ancylostoma ceylanicum TaxID=53326 RepID=A0A016T3Y2_9BILA|nr:hypothetical protein Y032_0141g2211 [Ancylostoma ceylanicum]